MSIGWEAECVRLVKEREQDMAVIADLRDVLSAILAEQDPVKVRTMASRALAATAPQRPGTTS